MLVWRHWEGALGGKAPPSLSGCPQGACGGHQGVGGGPGASLSWGMRSKSTEVTAIWWCGFGPCGCRRRWKPKEVRRNNVSTGRREG